MPLSVLLSLHGLWLTLWLRVCLASQSVAHAVLATCVGSAVLQRLLLSTTPNKNPT